MLIINQRYFSELTIISDSKQYNGRQTDRVYRQSGDALEHAGPSVHNTTTGGRVTHIDLSSSPGNNHITRCRLILTLY